MEVIESKNASSEPATETSESVPEVEAEKEADVKVENPYDIPDVEDPGAIKRTTQFLDALHKKLPNLVLKRRGGNWPSIMPNLGGKKTLGYIYFSKKSSRIETKEVTPEGKVLSHSWSYQIREDGIYAHGEKVKQKALIDEMVRFAKDRGWV